MNAMTPYATIHLTKLFTTGRLAGLTIEDRLTIRSAEEMAGWKSLPALGRTIRSGSTSYIVTDVREVLA